MSYPGTSHNAVSIRTNHIGDPSAITSYLVGNKKYLYINPDKPEFVGKKKFFCRIE